MKILIVFMCLISSFCQSIEINDKEWDDLQQNILMIDFYIKKSEIHGEFSYDMIQAIKYHVMKCKDLLNNNNFTNPSTH